MEEHQHDVAAMRSRAAGIRQSADAVRTLHDRVDRRVDALAFEGPAAMRFRASVSERSQRARRAAQRLDELADRIHAEANSIENRGAGSHGV